MKPFRYRKGRAEIVPATEFNAMGPEQQKAELKRMEAKAREAIRNGDGDSSELDAELAALDEDLAATLTGIEIVAERLRNAR